MYRQNRKFPIAQNFIRRQKYVKSIISIKIFIFYFIENLPNCLTQIFLYALRIVNNTLLSISIIVYL